MICPQCHKEVPVTEAQYLSMYTCPQCTAVYFIDIAGQPEFNDMSDSEKYATDLQNQLASEQKATENHSFPSEPDQLDQVLDQALEDSMAPLQEEFIPQVAEENSPVISYDDQSNLNPFQSSESIPESASVFSGAAQEISNFGNQNQEIHQMTYDLLVTGLDSKEILSLFKEALEDMKLGWLPQDVNSFIKNGQCTMTQLSPIQAFIIAKRIQFLDIEMKWTQNAIQ